VFKRILLNREKLADIYSTYQGRSLRWRLLNNVNTTKPIIQSNRILPKYIYTYLLQWLLGLVLECDWMIAYRL